MNKPSRFSFLCFCILFWMLLPFYHEASELLLIRQDPHKSDCLSVGPLSCFPQTPLAQMKWGSPASAPVCILPHSAYLRGRSVLGPSPRATLFYRSGHPSRSVPDRYQVHPPVIPEIQSAQSKDLPFGTIQTSSLASLHLAFCIPVGDSIILCNTEKLEVQFSMCCLQMTNVFC